MTPEGDSSREHLVRQPSVLLAAGGGKASIEPEGDISREQFVRQSLVLHDETATVVAVVVLEVETCWTQREDSLRTA